MTLALRQRQGAAADLLEIQSPNDEGDANKYAWSDGPAPSVRTGLILRK